MRRLARIVVPGQPHRVCQSRNNSQDRQDDFFVADDRRAYLNFLREHFERYGFSVLDPLS